MKRNTDANKSNKDLAMMYEPELFRLKNREEKIAFEQLLQTDIEVIDEIDGQLRELVKSLNPRVKIADKDYPALIEQHLAGTDVSEYGVWVYYPWCKRVLHLLDEEEFIEVRTNRNRYKLTRSEQAFLRDKKIGIVGLSVGQSIALTMAIERTAGEFRLADFDTVELSNLNRIRTGLHNLGLLKTVLAAREIKEIDPFITVRIFNDGLTVDNIDEFFTGNGKLDMLVEVCDGLDVKVRSRFKARELQIPVLMDTNDKGMLDVERYDLEPDRPILHGLAGDLNPDMIKDLTNEQKIPYILKMIGAETISTRLKASMMEVEQSINTWPQLASSVVLGGALTTDTARRILLDQFHDSGRYYIDFEQLIYDKEPVATETIDYEKDCPAELTKHEMEGIAAQYKTVAASGIDDDHLQQIIKAAVAAPSGGNAQPWKFLFKDNHLYIFHDIHFSYSLLDYKHLGSYLAFGAMLENIGIKAGELGLEVREDVFPLKGDKRLIAVLSFTASDNNKNELSYLAPSIPIRLTNRSVTERVLLPEEDIKHLKAAAETIPGAKLLIYDSMEDISLFADLMTNTERLRVIHPRGHYDTFVKELRFSKDDVLKTCDGMDVETLNMTNSERAALQIARDPEAIGLLHSWSKGEAFKKISQKPVLCASCIGLLTLDGDSEEHFLKGGRAVERVWLEATHRNIAFQPVSQAVFFMHRLKERGSLDFNEYEISELHKIRKQLESLMESEPGRSPIFMFRFLKAGVPEVRALRRPLEKVFYKA